MKKLSTEKYLSRVFTTIKKFKLVRNGDVVFIGLSGGKDSASSLISLKRYVDEKSIDCEIKGFHINFGLPMSHKVEDIVRKQANMAGVELLVFKAGDNGISLTDALRNTIRPICSVCGVVKRYLMNKVPRENGASKVVTGHHMDDFLVFFFKNVLGKNFSWISKFRPRLDSVHPKMLCKIRPLFMVGGEENRSFCKSAGIPFIEEDICPHNYLSCTVDVGREKWYEIIYDIEKKQKSFRYNMVNSIIKMAKFFEVDYRDEIRECSICGEPTSKDVCSFCRIFKVGKR